MDKRGIRTNEGLERMRDKDVIGRKRDKDERGIRTNRDRDE